MGTSSLKQNKKNQGKDTNLEGDRVGFESKWRYSVVQHGRKHERTLENKFMIRATQERRPNYARGEGGGTRGSLRRMEQHWRNSGLDRSENIRDYSSIKKEKISSGVKRIWTEALTFHKKEGADIEPEKSAGRVGVMSLLGGQP